MAGSIDRHISTCRERAPESTGETPFLPLFTARSPLLSPESKKQTANLSASSSDFPRPTPRRFWGHLTFADPKKANSDRCRPSSLFHPLFRQEGHQSPDEDPPAMASVATRASLPRDGKGKAPARAPSPSPAAFPFDEALNDLMQVRPAQNRQPQ